MALIDTDASCSLIDEDFVRTHSNCPIEPATGLATFQSTNEEPMTIKGKVSLIIKVNSLAMPYDFFVVPQLVNTLILGQCVLEQQAIVVDCRHRMVHFHDYLTATPLLDSPSSCHLQSHLSQPTLCRL